MLAAYCRTSTTRQKNDSQIAEIEKWLAAHGHDLAQVQWFIDQESGKTLKRPQFERLQKAIFNGEIKTVVIWKLDRLSRRLRDGVNVLVRLVRKGHSHRRCYATDRTRRAGRQNDRRPLLGLAEIELEYRHERQMAGIEVARKKGVFLGRQKGTTKGKPDRAWELRANGLRVQEIAQALGTSERTVQRYLTRATQ